MNKRRGLPAVLSLLIFSILFLSACGGGDGETEEEKVETTIREVVKGDDPAICAEMETATIREQISGESGEDALKACEEEKKEEGESAVKSLQIKNVVAEEESATADVSFIGGNLDGQTLTMSLVKEDGDQWKLDEMLAFKGFDREALLSAYREALGNAAETREERVFGGCVVDLLEYEPSKELEKIVLDPENTPLDLIFEICEE